MARRPVAERHHPQTVEPVFTLQHHVVGREDVHVLQHHVLAMGKHLRPALHRRIVVGRGDEAEVAPPARVGADVEAARAMIDLVLVILLARQDRSPGALDTIRGQIAMFRGGEGPRGAQDEGAAPRAPNSQTKQFVFFLPQERVVALAQAMSPQAVGALGIVLGHVEEGGGVGRPRDGGHPLDAIGQQHASAEVLHVERVLAKAGGVDRVGEEVPVVRHRVHAQRDERQAGGEGIEVEGDLLGGGEGPGLAAVDRVLLALLRAREVEVAPAPVGDGLVVLFDARQHLPVEPLLEGLGGLHHRVGVGVLGVQVGVDLPVFLAAQPVVLVDQALAVDDGFPGVFPGAGGHGQRGGAGGHPIHITR